MAEIRFRFIERRDRIALRHGAAPKAGKLRKDEPHPVRLFETGLQFSNNLAIHIFLRIHESLKIVWIARHLNSGAISVMNRSRSRRSSSAGRNIVGMNNVSAPAV